MKEPNKKDVNGFFCFLSMGYQTYQEILTRNGDRSKPKQPHYENPCQLELSWQLRYLTLDSNHSLMYGLVYNTDSNIIIRSAMRYLQSLLMN
ncbi:hypothetical protein DPMN_162719 [Dreissena polymorpha]|uniref:Uncharacterized protein n=1 Tax=Dreissena polymorpha TaxID=45954 RepID=A0A9D4ER01_DREPO|nr:hypothetical protein DPMN_162719 [Dreissena polymorpha]